MLYVVRTSATININALSVFHKAAFKLTTATLLLDVRVKTLPCLASHSSSQ